MDIVFTQIVRCIEPQLAALCVRLYALVPSEERIRPILLRHVVQGGVRSERAIPTICPTTSASIYRRTSRPSGNPCG